MRIIGHRGAAGLALENSLEAIRAGIEAGVDAVEFDIRLTADGKFILSHDADTGRVSKRKLEIHQHKLAKLKQLRLHNGEALLTLEEAIKAAGQMPLIIEVKGSHWSTPLAKYLETHTVKKVAVISFNHDELGHFHKLQPTIPTYAIEQTSPVEVIQTAVRHGFTGIDINFWLLNPLTYWLARFHKLDILVYTVNNRWIARCLRFFYPNIGLTTNVPQHFQHFRRLSRLEKRAKTSKIT